MIFVSIKIKLRDFTVHMLTKKNAERICAKHTIQMGSIILTNDYPLRKIADLSNTVEVNK